MHLEGAKPSRLSASQALHVCTGTCVRALAPVCTCSVTCVQALAAVCMIVPEGLTSTTLFSRDCKSFCPGHNTALREQYAAVYVRPCTYDHESEGAPLMHVYDAHPAFCSRLQGLQLSE